ncbi:MULTISPECIES: hypothetical protein [unclassified Enterococcus]|uniref:hypothetical protein n=1 Tax=unclassified Enterococcus TaxID=2608891 RepID=UPI0013ECF096|nr:MULTISPECIES: hypothetical protein [unclassified Enterococcus]
MKKPIEELFLYKLNELMCKVLVASLIGNSVFLVLIAGLWMYGMEIPVWLALFIYALSMFLCSYLIVAYLSEVKRDITKKLVKQLTKVNVVFQLSAFLLLLDMYYFVKILQFPLSLPMFLYLAILSFHSCSTTMFEVYEGDEQESIHRKLLKNLHLLTKDIKGNLCYVGMTAIFLWLYEYHPFLLLLLYPGLPFVAAYKINSREKRPE